MSCSLMGAQRRRKTPPTLAASSGQFEASVYASRRSFVDGRLNRPPATADFICRFFSGPAAISLVVRGLISLRHREHLYAREYVLNYTNACSHIEHRYFHCADRSFFSGSMQWGVTQLRPYHAGTIHAKQGAHDTMCHLPERSGGRPHS